MGKDLARSCYDFEQARMEYSGLTLENEVLDLAREKRRAEETVEDVFEGQTQCPCASPQFKTAEYKPE